MAYGRIAPEQNKEHLMNINRNIRLVIALLLMAVVSASVTAQTREQAPSWSERLVRLTLLHLNDVYQISPVDKGKSAGLARVATMRKRIQAEAPNTLFMLAGDTLSPSVASNIFKGAQMISAWNSAGLDYAVLGNHEFDFGDEVLVERMMESKFVWLGSNVIDRTTNRPFNDMPPYILRTFDGVRVGIIGLLTPETSVSSSPGPDIRFVDPNSMARKLVKKMRSEGAQVIIALTHLNMNEDKELAATGLVDIILGGHEHEMLQSVVGKTPIFKWGSDARHMGRIDLTIRVSTGQILSIDSSAIPINETVPDDPQTGAVIAEYETKLSRELGKTIGSTSVDLDARQVANRSGETNLGNLVADAFRQQTGADVALVNGGSIRSNTTYPTGSLTKRDIMSILPFENPVVKIQVSGAIIRAALENGVSQVKELRESGRFPHVSGISFEYDCRNPVGSRIISITINGSPLDDARIYSLAATSYLIHGGDGYKMFGDVKYLINEESAQIDTAIVLDFITKAGHVSPQVDGRIRRVDLLSKK